MLNVKEIAVSKSSYFRQGYLWLLLLLLISAICVNLEPWIVVWVLVTFIWLIFLYYHVESGLILLIASAPFLIVVSETKLVAQLTGVEIPKTLLRVPKDIWLLSLLGVWGLHLVHKRYRLPIKENELYPVYIPILCFIGLAFIYTFVSPEVKAGFWGLRSTVEFILVFLLTIAILTRAQDIQKAIELFLWSGLLFSLWGLYRIFTTKIGLGTWFEVMPEHIVGRLTVFGDEHSANAYAIFMAMLVGFCLGALVYRNKLVKSWRYLLGLTLFFGGINLVFTFSRRAWLGVFIASLVIGFLAGKSRIIIRFLLIACIAVVIAYFIQPLALTALFSRITTFDPSHITIRERLDEWTVLFQRMLDSNLLGIGLGMVGPVGVLYEIPDATLTHNYYLLLLIEMGMFGLFLFIWILGSILRFGFRLFRILPESFEKTIVLGLLACIIILIISALGGVTFESFPNNLHFWFFAGLLVCIHKLAKLKQTVFK
ncbi:MAG: O-antigen ligase family protein [bacterium]|nr:O-antigen ligase family protein [bacterium]